MARPRPDFAMVRLSEAGRRLAGEHGVLRWANSRRHFSFEAGIAVEVERSFEWNALLRNERFEGEPMFEEALEEVIEESVKEVEDSQQIELPEGTDAE